MLCLSRITGNLSNVIPCFQGLDVNALPNVTFQDQCAGSMGKGQAISAPPTSSQQRSLSNSQSFSTLSPGCEEATESAAGVLEII